MASAGMLRTIRPRASVRQAILTGWLLCGVLDITAACIQAWIQAGRTPAMVLKGVASALWGRGALDAGAGMAAIGLTMHLAVALTATLVFYALSRRGALLGTAPLLIVGPLYGVVVFAAMNYGTLPLLSWVRSLYLDTPPRWPGSMGWPQLGIHAICVGLPIVWGVRRARSATKYPPRSRARTDAFVEPFLKGETPKGMFESKP